MRATVISSLGTPCARLVRSRMKRDASGAAMIGEDGPILAAELAFESDQIMGCRGNRALWDQTVVAHPLYGVRFFVGDRLVFWA